MTACIMCGEELKENLPGIDVSEAPYWERVDSVEDSNPPEITFDYFCSNRCVRTFVMNQLQHDVGSWADENFDPDQPAAYCLLGAMEELGEVASCHGGLGRLGMLLDAIDLLGRVCHSELKRAQGIRLDEHGVDPAYEDEIIAALMMLLEDFDPRGDLGTVTEAVASTHQIADGVGDEIVYLSDYMHRVNADHELGEAIELAWDGEVKRREWDSEVEIPD